MTELANIVCFGKDLILLQTRRAVLAQHFHITPVSTLARMLELSLTCSFELAVLCHTLSELEYRQCVASTLCCGPRAGIVALSSSTQSHSLQGADRIVNGLDGPAALIAAVRSVLRERLSLTAQPSPAIAAPLAIQR